MKKLCSLILSSLILSQTAVASFEETSRRYLTNYEIVAALQFILPSQTCTENNLANETSTLGVNSALSGAPISQTPTHATVALITRCIKSAVSENGLSGAMGKVIGHENQKALTLNGGLWSSVPEDLQKKVIAHTVMYILGSDETIGDYGIIDPQVLREKIFQALKTKNIGINAALTAIITNLVLRDEFLSY